VVLLGPLKAPPQVCNQFNLTGVLHVVLKRLLRGFAARRVMLLKVSQKA